MRPSMLGLAALALFTVSTRGSAAPTCTGVSTSSNTSLASVAVATGLTGRPLFVAAPPGDVNRIFILEQSGFIRIKKHGDPPTTVSLFLDISAKVQANPNFNEMGLLGLAFDPDYATNGRFYVNYTEGSFPFGPFASVVARYTVSANPDVADPTSEVRIMRYAQPQTNHKAGNLEFGPDGFLYINTGDGGGAGDVHGTCGNGQDLASVLGKILRIDVRGVDPSATSPDCSGLASPIYKVPFSNPFRNGSGGACDEVWAYGFRNPWRSSFDSATGDLYIGDVGQECWEEIDWVASGTGAARNYGWRQMEGNHCYNSAAGSPCDPAPVACGSSPACNDPSITDPVFDYNHAGSPGGCAVTGGFVYRGCRMPGFLGKYFYGDYCGGWVQSFVIAGGLPTNPQVWTAALDPTGTLVNGLSSFGTDAQGELYITDNSAPGQVLKVVPPFADLEVSGAGAGGTFLLDRTADWTWEDLFRSTDVPVSLYRVYRGVPNGAFDCVFKSATPRWPSGGDPATPAAGQLFAYVVVGVNASGAETLTGHPGTFNAATCP